MSESNIGDIMGTSLEKVKELAGTGTVIGEPIQTPSGVTVIPVSKVSMGFASGGVDFPKKKNGEEETAKKDRFGGGGGTGVSITPIAFLTVSPEGKIDLIPIVSPKNIDTVDKIAALIERSPDILERLKEVIIPPKKEKNSQ
ncbi:MAG: sporulation protein YtfJ [Clostridia bacterium]|nr:sporulation protein YtfJ [Clostridia bacterium]